MDLWFDYRRVWATHRWMQAYALLIVIVVGLAIYGTFARNALAILFIPALAATYAHHLMVQKRLDS